MFTKKSSYLKVIAIGFCATICCMEDPAGPTAPSAPTGTGASGITSTEATISWTEVSGATSYIIYREDLSSARDTVTSATYTDTGLTSATAYLYEISALGPGGESERSALIPVTTKCLAPSGLQATDSSESEIAISWTAVVGSTSYFVYRQDVTGVHDTVTSRMYTDSGLSAGTQYAYQISALGEAGESEKSALLSVSTICPAPEPGTGILLSKPDACQSFRVGDTMEIAWDIDSARAALQLDFSADNGIHYIAIPDAIILVGDATYSTGPFKWVIPDTLSNLDGSDMFSTVSDSCKVRIREYLLMGFEDATDRPFKINERQ